MQKKNPQKKYFKKFFFSVFSPDAKTAVLVYTNQRVVECSVETGRYTQFSHSLSQSMPAEWTARKFPIRGTLLPTYQCFGSGFIDSGSKSSILG